MDLYLTGRNTLVRDCTFKDSRSFSDTFNGVSICVGLSSITVDVERCSITGVRTAVKGDSYSAGACMKDLAAISGSNVRIRDSYFANNFISCKDGSNGNRAYGCVYGMQSGNRHSFVNCTFEGNTIVKTNTSSHVSMITGGYNNYWATLVNCVFKDNDCYKVSDGSVTNRIAEIDYGGWGYFYMVNTIMTHSAADYVPFVNTKPVFVADCVKNLTYPAGSIAPSLTGDPKLAAAPATNGCVIAWGLECGSPCRKGGYLVWEGTDRQLYFRDPTAAAATPWRSLTTKGLVTDEAAAAVGVSLAAKPLPDAFGATWKENRVALGPLPAPVSGLSVLVR